MRNVSMVVVAVMLAAALAGCDGKDKSTGEGRIGSIAEQALNRAASQPATGTDLLMTVQVELSPVLTGRGLYRTMAKFDPATRTLTVSLVARTGYQGRLIARALDGRGAEAGRGGTAVDLQHGGSGTYSFAISGSSTEGQIEKYILEAAQ